MPRIIDNITNKNITFGDINHLLTTNINKKTWNSSSLIEYWQSQDHYCIAMIEADDKDQDNKQKSHEGVRFDHQTINASHKKHLIYSLVISKVVLDEAEILFMATNHDYRRNNCATILFNNLCDQLGHKSIRSIFLEVDEQNINAIKFYNKNGFVKYNQRKSYYANGNDALLLKYSF